MLLIAHVGYRWVAQCCRRPCRGPWRSRQAPLAALRCSRSARRAAPKPRRAAPSLSPRKVNCLAPLRALTPDWSSASRARAQEPLPACSIHGLVLATDAPCFMFSSRLPLQQCSERGMTRPLMRTYGSQRPCSSCACRWAAGGGHAGHTEGCASGAAARGPGEAAGAVPHRRQRCAADHPQEEVISGCCHWYCLKGPATLWQLCTLSELLRFPRAYCGNFKLFITATNNSKHIVHDFVH